MTMADVRASMVVQAPPSGAEPALPLARRRSGPADPRGRTDRKKTRRGRAGPGRARAGTGHRPPAPGTVRLPRPPREGGLSGGCARTLPARPRAPSRDQEPQDRPRYEVGGTVERAVGPTARRARTG